MNAQYPIGPGARNTDTSIEAARRIAPSLAPLQEVVLGALAEHGDMATFEIAKATGRSYRSIQPRTAELSRMGRIMDSGKRATDPDTQRSAIVWKLR